MVSVCVPSYNGAAFIRQTIHSVLEQSFTNFELVVVDDKSTDETISIVRGISDPRLRVIESSMNLGLGANWNKALASVLGKYVKLLCQDDVLHSDCLERQVAILEHVRHEGIVLAVCNRNVINSSGRVVVKPRRVLRRGVLNGRHLIQACVRHGQNFIGEPVVGLFRRDALTLKEVCDPANPYMSDVSLWAEVLRHGDAWFDPCCMASFRISADAASSGIGLRQAGYYRSFAKKLRRDPHYEISAVDLLLAAIRSSLWCVLRNVFIRLHTLRKPPQQIRSQQAAAGEKTFVPNPSHESCT